MQLEHSVNKSGGKRSEEWVLCQSRCYIFVQEAAEFNKKKIGKIFEALCEGEEIPMNAQTDSEDAMMLRDGYHKKGCVMVEEFKKTKEPITLA